MHRKTDDKIQSSSDLIITLLFCLARQRSGPRQENKIMTLTQYLKENYGADFELLNLYTTELNGAKTDEEKNATIKKIREAKDKLSLLFIDLYNELAMFLHRDFQADVNLMVREIEPIKEDAKAISKSS